MRLSKYAKRGTIGIALALLSMAGCHKDTATAASTTTSSDDDGASDAARLEQTSNDVISIADLAATSGGSNLRTTGNTAVGCATVSFDTLSSPHTLTIDFGPTNCTGLDGRVRRGAIIVAYQGHYKDSGSVHTITYNNYFLNDRQVKGIKAVTNLGMNSSGNVIYNITLADTIVLNTDSTISWTGNRNRTWLTGYATAARSDDQYTVTGTTSLKRANGQVFTFDITSPLTIAIDCQYIEAGQITISGATIPTARIIDYGTTAACDNMATINIDGYVYDITLH